MKNRYLIILTLMIFVIGNSQEKVISGQIIHLENNDPIPYVNIGIKNESVGTVSDKNGLFELFLDEKTHKNDTIIISHVGFKSKKINVATLKPSKNIITLEPESIELEEVVISSKKTTLKNKKLGRTITGLGLMHANFYTAAEKNVDDRLSKEKGVRIKINKNCHLKDLNFKITTNDFKSLKFRVNFYKIENGLPTDLIVFENIVFEIKDNFLGWFKVDLEEYDIFLTEDLGEIAVAIQWVESVKSHEKSKFFGIAAGATTSKETFHRDKAMDRWTSSDFNLSFYLNAMCD